MKKNDKYHKRKLANFVVCALVVIITLALLLHHSPLKIVAKASYKEFLIEFQCEFASYAPSAS